MARYIDADMMREDWLENGENEYVYDTNAVLQSIDEQPTADVVEVVRCKDCEYYSKNILGSGYVCQYWQTWYQTNGNDYCSFGAKMDGKKVE